MKDPLSTSGRSTLLENLLRPECYPHPARSIEVLETHISWVFLTGVYAYKIKKPVDLGFVDFTTLDKRRFACEEELRLNRRLAADLYINVAEIRGSPEVPRIDGSGPLMEYAVRMRQFPQEALATRVLTRGALTPALLDGLASRLALFHERASGEPPDPKLGTCRAVLHDASENFEQIASLLTDGYRASAYPGLRDWTEREYLTRYSALRARRESGMIRECHGDLHLRNIVLVDGELVPFDCIEFSPALRWIDVASEVAFLAMDLMDRSADALAWHFLNIYLEETGAYSSVALLRFYLVYRAIVRSKVHLMRAGQRGLPQEERERLIAASDAYAALAQRCARGGRPAILLMHGFSGCGKSTVALSLAETLGAFRIRSDVERKRIHGLGARARSSSAIAADVYGHEGTEATYSRLTDIARLVVASGYTAILDATFLQRAQRSRLIELAAQMGVPIAIAGVWAPEPLLRSRIISRAKHGHDASDAGLAVLDHQLATAEPVRPEENVPVLRIDGGKPPDGGALRAMYDRLFSREQALDTTTADGS
jgi:aminoglycoside phosphotransferase family enzyme/predicted kinase